MVFASRVDVLMYGRYNEHILGLFILAGLYEILYFLKKKTCTIMMMVHILLGLFIAWVINKNNITDINSFNIMGIFRYMCTCLLYTSVIMPIFMGGGMKVKTAEALMNGKTIFGSKEAFEGYDLEDISGLYLCEDKDAFINCLLYTSSCV